MEFQLATIFVHNLPEKTHWKGLWAAFGHHGEVIDAFIPMKRSRSGRIFGFVRSASKNCANRAIARLNGFTLFGYRVILSFARFKSRTSYWRKVNPEQIRKAQQRDSKRNDQDSKPANTLRLQNNPRQSDVNQENSVRKHGPSKPRAGDVFSQQTVAKKGEIKVKRMACRLFLLEIEDNLLYNFLKDSRCSYLLDIFMEIPPWTNSFRIPDRVVWLELTGVPLHCWNHQTFKRIAETWGVFVFLGENALQSFGLEKLSMVISTSQFEKIEAFINLEVGNKLFPVRISEIPSPKEKHDVFPKTYKGKACCEYGISSKSSSSSSSRENFDLVESTGDKKVRPRDIINSDCMGNTNFTSVNLVDKYLNWQIGEQELQGSSTQMDRPLASWAESIENANSVWNHIQTREARRHSSQSEEGKAESTEDYFPDRVLTEAEKKRRDGHLRIIKKKIIEDAALEIDVTPISSSVLRHIKESLIRDARSTIEFGKQLGFEVKGDLQEAILDMARIIRLFLQETRLTCFTLEEARKLWGDDDVEFVVSPEIGRSGDIVTVWDKFCFIFGNTIVHQRFDTFGIGLSVSLGGTFSSEKSIFKLLDCCDVFNTVCLSSDRSECSGCSNPLLGVDDFLKLFEECILFDLALNGKEFSWIDSNNRSSLVGSSWLKLRY
ncbi:hypothetical protein GQ457_08G017280 [Hibiscus cannabinus]